MPINPVATNLGTAQKTGLPLKMPPITVKGNAAPSAPKPASSPLTQSIRSSGAMAQKLPTMPKVNSFTHSESVLDFAVKSAAEPEEQEDHKTRFTRNLKRAVVLGGAVALASRAAKKGGARNAYRDSRESGGSRSHAAGKVMRATAKGAKDMASKTTPGQSVGDFIAGVAGNNPPK